MATNAMCPNFLPTICLVILLVQANMFVLVVDAFSECKSPCLQADPEIASITNCVQWLAHLQSTGVQPREWCLKPNNLQKCCLTCQNYLSLNSCNDKANESDCKHSATKRLCNNRLSDSLQIKDICAKSCGCCTPSSYLTCASLAVGCASDATCLPTSAYSVPTIQCVCPPSRGGTYCQEVNICSISASALCQNGGTCVPLFEQEQTYVCSCPAGFVGRNCEREEKPTDPETTCLNGGTRVTENDLSRPVPYCACPAKYTGNRCENYIGDCFSNPCLNGGTCMAPTNDTTGYICLCKPNYSGKNCDYAVTYAMCQAGDKNATRCAEWKASGLCRFEYFYGTTPVPLYCPLACNMCECYQRASCQDEASECPMYAQLNFCSHINEYSPNLCRKSCGGKCSAARNLLN